MDLLGNKEATRLRAGQWRQRLSDWINAHPGEEPPSYLQRMAETELGMERGGFGASFATQAFDTSAQREQAAATTRKTRAEADVEEARAATGQEALKEIKRKATEKAAPTATTTPALDREIKAFRRRWNLNEGEYPTDYGAKQALQTLEQRRADVAQEQYDENQKNKLLELKNQAEYYKAQQRSKDEETRGQYGVKKAETAGEAGVKREEKRGEWAGNVANIGATSRENVANIYGVTDRDVENLKQINAQTKKAGEWDLQNEINQNAFMESRCIFAQERKDDFSPYTREEAAAEALKRFPRAKEEDVYSLVRTGKPFTPRPDVESYQDRGTGATQATTAKRKAHHRR